MKTHLFQVLCNPFLSCPLLPPPPPTTLSVVLLLWLNVWSCHIWCATLLNAIRDLYMSSLGTLVAEIPWCVFYALRHQVYWWYSKLDITHTKTQRTCMQQQLAWQTHINIYLLHLLCSNSSYLYCIEWIIHWHQKFTFIFFSFKKLFTCKNHVCWLDSLGRSSSCETRIKLTDMV